MYRQEGSFGSSARYANEDGPHCGQSGVASPGRLGGRTPTACLLGPPPTIVGACLGGSLGTGEQDKPLGGLLNPSRLSDMQPPALSFVVLLTGRN